MFQTFLLSQYIIPFLFLLMIKKKWQREKKISETNTDSKKRGNGHFNGPCFLQGNCESRYCHDLSEKDQGKTPSQTNIQSGQVQS